MTPSEAIAKSGTITCDTIINAYLRGTEQRAREAIAEQDRLEAERFECVRSQRNSGRE